MPRIHQKKKEYKEKDFAVWVLGEMKLKGISQDEMAAEMNVSQPTFSRKAKSGEFTYKEIIILFQKFETPEEKITQLMTL